MAESEEELKSILMRVKEESEKINLKLNIQKMKIMESGPITSWQTVGEKTWKQWQTLFSWAPKSLQTVTATTKLKDTCSLEEKLWQTYKVLKSNLCCFANKSLIVKAMAFPVVMYGCERWVIKVAECQRIDAFELWC